MNICFGDDDTSTVPATSTGAPCVHPSSTVGYTSRSASSVEPSYPVRYVSTGTGQSAVRVEKGVMDGVMDAVAEREGVCVAVEDGVFEPDRVLEGVFVFVGVLDGVTLALGEEDAVMDAVVVLVLVRVELRGHGRRRVAADKGVWKRSPWGRATRLVGGQCGLPPRAHLSDGCAVCEDVGVIVCEIVCVDVGVPVEVDVDVRVPVCVLVLDRVWVVVAVGDGDGVMLHDTPEYDQVSENDRFPFTSLPPTRM